MLWRRRRSTTTALRSGSAPLPSYAVTLTQVQFGTLIVATAAALPNDPPWWQWYRNGQPAALTQSNQFGTTAAPDDPPEIFAIALDSTDFDAWDFVPASGDGRFTLEWGDVDDDAIVSYRIDYAYAAPTNWTETGRVERNGQWRYAWASPRFDSGLDLYLRVVPMTAAGDDGTVIQVGPLTTARRPDAPVVSVSYAAGTQRITISE